MAATDLVEIGYEYLRQRGEDAVLFSIDEVDVWLPWEFIHDWDEQEKTLRIPEWLAIDRELV